MAETSRQYPDRAVIPEKEPEDRFKQIQERYRHMSTGWSGIHEEGKDDDGFIAGEQWDRQVKQQRIDDGRPVHVYNLLLTYVNQIVNNVRQNTPRLRVRPVDGFTGQDPRLDNVQGTRDYSQAEVLSGIIRNIENVSRADQAYDTAIEHSVAHGFGFFRVMNRWTRDDSFEQELKIERIKNSYSVLIDPECEEADFSDAFDAFVSVLMPLETFRAKYPDARGHVSNFDAFGSNEMRSLWYTGEKVRVAEYFWLDYQADEVLLMSNRSTHFLSDVEDGLDELEREKGIHVLKSRKVRRRTCWWGKTNGLEWLDDPVKLPFSIVPICPVVGKELMVDGDTRYTSAIRFAKDPQQAFNYWMNAATEKVALAPRAPWILTEDQIEGHESEWDTANQRNLPYLVYNHVEGQDKPTRTFMTDAAAAELAQAQAQQQIIRDIVGVYEANLGADGNEKSGKAIIARQNRGDLTTFVFPDNLSRAMAKCGRLCVEAIPQVYTGDRQMRIRNPDDTEDFVRINEAVRDDRTGKTIVMHDIARGRYDVVLDTGPSYATQRQEAQDAILETMGKLPQDKAALVAHLLVKNMDFPGADEVYEILRRTLPDELKSEEERAKDLPKGYVFDDEGNVVNEQTGDPLPEQEPTMEQQLAEAQLKQAMSEAEAATIEAEAKKIKSEADVMTARAKVMEAEAKLQAAQEGGGDTADPQAELDAANEQLQAAIMQEVERIVREAMAAHEESEKAHAGAIGEAVTESAVDTLNRVRGAYGEPGAQVAAGPAANDSPTDVQQTSNSRATDVQPTAQHVIVSSPRIQRIKFAHNDAGELEGTPEYASERSSNGETPRLSKVRAAVDGNGDVVEAEAEYE